MINSLFDFRFVALALSINLIAIMLETGLDVPVHAQQEVIFKPGKLAIALTGLKQDLEPGDTIDLFLNFKNAGKMTIQAKVNYH